MAGVKRTGWSLAAHDTRAAEASCNAISRWVDLVEKAVQFTPDDEPAIYHCLTQAAYVGVFVQTADRRIPIVRQFRPCVEGYTWEFPAGTVDRGETPEESARREVLEETGLQLGELSYLGNFHPDTGRLQIESHAFYARAVGLAPNFSGESGLTVKYVTHPELKQMIVSGEFRHQLHVAIYAAALARDLQLD
jgi:ADP-ribose pyrophosphatase